jgi:VanZ family protein
MSFRIRPLTLAILWTIFIMVLLTIPGKSIPSVSIFEFDKLIHAGLFFVLTVAWLRAVAGRYVYKAVLVVGAILIFSFVSEWFQEVLPIGRTADVFDAVADSIGALIGLATWSIWGFFQGKPKE